MKALTMFYLEDCGYCTRAFRALDELFTENPAYREVPIKKIEESLHPEFADQYDYYATPAIFEGDEKLFEARLFMSYDDIRNGLKRALDHALE